MTASSAAPTYFAPKIIGRQVLIDGGLIANNPSYYAYLHARFNLNKKKIRIISLGCGMTRVKKITDPT